MKPDGGNANCIGCGSEGDDTKTAPVGWRLGLVTNLVWSAPMEAG